MTRQLKSRDLGPEYPRCADSTCPSWESGCARAEHQLGLARFNWIAMTRQRMAKSCDRRIAPETLQPKPESKPGQGIVDM